MSRLQVKTPSQADAAVEQLYRNMEQRIAASPPGLCPVDLALNFLNLCRAQTCGKCVPCRIGLTQLANMLQEVLEGEPDPHILHHIEVTAEVIVNTADCAIGIDAANMVLVGLKGFREDYEEHILHHRCLGYLRHPGALRGPLPRRGGHPRLHRPGAGGPLARMPCASSARTIPSPPPAPTSASTPARPAAAATWWTTP